MRILNFTDFTGKKYFNSMQIEDCSMTKYQKFKLSKIVYSVPYGNIFIDPKLVGCVENISIVTFITERQGNNGLLAKKLKWTLMIQSISSL